MEFGSNLNHNFGIKEKFKEKEKKKKRKKKKEKSSQLKKWKILDTQAARHVGF